MNKTPYTFLGILISYFSITSLNLLFKTFYGDQLDDGPMLAKELLIFGMIGLLFWIILKKESLSLESIGLHGRKWKASIGWGLLNVVICFALGGACIYLAQLLGWKFGESKSFDKLSLATIAFITLRAGVAEEVFMRGYLIERLTDMTKNVYTASLLALVPFALFHFSQGYAGILISFVLGGYLTIVYIWRRDLKSNIITHFLVDFIPNVAVPLMAPGL
ncbi:MAG TPA: type II CAAX endopeptidase family protein [Chryseolinea sp.]